MQMMLMDGAYEIASKMMMIQWPDDREFYAFVNGLSELSEEMAMALEEVVNAHVAATAQAAFYAGFQAGRHPELLIFKENER